MFSQVHPLAFWSSLFVLALAAQGLAVPLHRPISKDDATLSSDEMELIHNGSEVVFTGHALLIRKPYQLKADRMTRQESARMVHADGHVIGTWRNPAGGKLVARGDHAKYDATIETAELWTEPKKQVDMQWNDAKGSAHFLSDRAFMYMSPKHVRLVDHVTGRITPTEPAQPAQTIYGPFQPYGPWLPVTPSPSWKS